MCDESKKAPHTQCQKTNQRPENNPPCCAHAPPKKTPPMTQKMCVIFGECHDIVAVQISECENQAQNSVQTSEHVQVFCADLMASACEGTCASTVHEGEHHHKTQILLLLLSPNYPSE